MAKKFVYPDLSVDAIAGAVMAQFPTCQFTCVTNVTRVHTAAADRSLDVFVSCIGDGYPLKGFGGLTFIDCRNNRPDLLTERRDAAKVRDIGHYCHQIAFACPEGMATVEDMDATVGLFVVNGEGVGRWLKMPVPLAPRRDTDRYFFQRTLARMREQHADDESKVAIEEAAYRRAEVAVEAKLRREIENANRDRDWAIRQRDDLTRRNQEFCNATGLSLDNYRSRSEMEIAAVRAVLGGRALDLPASVEGALRDVKRAVAELERAAAALGPVAEMRADCKFGPAPGEVSEPPIGGSDQGSRDRSAAG